VVGSRGKAVHETALVVDSIRALVPAVNITRFCALLIHDWHMFITQAVTFAPVLVESLL